MACPPPQIGAALTPQWQQPGQPVTLTAYITETGPLYTGYVWTEVAGPDPISERHLTRPAQSDQPWQTVFAGGLEGYYTTTVIAHDEAGNVATGSALPLIIDGTKPGLSLTLAASPPYGYVDVAKEIVYFYYGQGSGLFTVTAVAADSMSRLNTLTFPDATAAGALFALSGAANASRVYPYTFEPGDTFSRNYRHKRHRSGGEPDQTLPGYFQGCGGANGSHHRPGANRVDLQPGLERAGWPGRPAGLYGAVPGRGQPHLAGLADRHHPNLGPVCGNQGVQLYLACGGAGQ